jgi:hypothetical protein
MLRQLRMLPGCPAAIRQTHKAVLVDETTRTALLRRGFAPEFVTLGWNVIGVAVLAAAAIAARSVALAEFGLDSLIEIGASTVVIWELSGTGHARQRRALRLIGCAFAALAVYLLVQSTVVLAGGYHPRHSAAGIGWTAVTTAVMFALAFGKARTGAALGNPVLQTEGRVTLVDGILATAVLAGLALNAALGWWWPIPPPDTCSSSTPPVRYARSSPGPDPHRPEVPLPLAASRLPAGAGVSAEQVGSVWPGDLLQRGVGEVRQPAAWPGSQAALGAGDTLVP